ncbi:MAG: hypothetical protein ACI814_000804 [Mariniblastus sp.]|jgi:hypothetical protein
MGSDNQPKTLITLVSFPTEAEAVPVVEALQAAGISATMTGGFTAGFIAEAPGMVAVKVFEKDRETSEEVLRQFGLENEAIDWSKVDVGDPE